MMAARAMEPTPPAPNLREVTTPHSEAVANVGAPSGADHADPVLPADPAIASVADTGIPHVVVPAGLVRNLVDVLLMFVGEYGDPVTWPEADVSKLAAAHAVLARAATPIAPAAIAP